MWRLPSLALCISHPLPIPRILPCLRARVDVYECRGGKRSKVSPRGALNLPAARILQTERFDPACAQGSPVRCGCARCRQARPAAVVRARTHTSTRAQRCLRSAHTQLAQLPYPQAPPPSRPPFQHSFGQLKIVNRPTPQTSALFSGPHGLSGSLGTS